MKLPELVCEVCGAKKKAKTPHQTTSLCNCGNLMITSEALAKVKAEDALKGTCPYRIGHPKCDIKNEDCMNCAVYDNYNQGRNLYGGRDA